MKDSDVSKNLNKSFSLPLYDLKIEAVTKMVRARDPYRTSDHFREGQADYVSNVRMIPMSLPRVRWLDRADV
jgi:hypothetical protein